MVELDGMDERDATAVNAERPNGLDGETGKEDMCAAGKIEAELDIGIKGAFDNDPTALASCKKFGELSRLVGAVTIEAGLATSVAEQMPIACAAEKEGLDEKAGEEEVSDVVIDADETTTEYDVGTDAVESVLVANEPDAGPFAEADETMLPYGISGATELVTEVPVDDKDDTMLETVVI